MKSYKKQALDSIADELRRRNEAAGFVVENAMKRKAPVDTGRLRSSITHDADENGVVVGTNVEYAKFQELGTRHQDGTPFLVPGLVESIPDLRRIYGSEV